MNTKTIFSALVILLVTGIQQVSAQFNAFNVGKLEVYAFVRQGEESIGKAVATLYEDVENTGNWVQVQQMKTNVNGEFGFKLDYNSRYMIEIAKANYITKKVTFDTNVFDKTITSQDFYFAVDFVPGTSATESMPVGNVFYQVEKNKFGYELAGEKAQAK
ncbi:MAG: hypothetical protein POELPBGB_00513 [Bacteroidia bacterium]|nr:hypothetical protein [Bacteroidia bacterium]